MKEIWLYYNTNSVLNGLMELPKQETSTLVDYGKVGGYSSMAATVGYPVAIATKFVLDGTIKGPGLLAPYSPEINDPIMKELKDKYGIYLKEKTVA